MIVLLGAKFKWFHGLAKRLLTVYMDTFLVGGDVISWCSHYLKTNKRAIELWRQTYVQLIITKLTSKPQYIHFPSLDFACHYCTRFDYLGIFCCKTEFCLQYRSSNRPVSCITWATLRTDRNYTLNKIPMRRYRNVSNVYECVLNGSSMYWNNTHLYGRHLILHLKILQAFFHITHSPCDMKNIFWCIAD